jgi:hypothetical protein
VSLELSFFPSWAFNNYQLCFQFKPVTAAACFTICFFGRTAATKETELKVTLRPRQQNKVAATINIRRPHLKNKIMRRSN